MDAFDYIVVGAGSAGCVLADRLSRDGRHRVLVVEAGPGDLHPYVKLPIGYGRLFYHPRLNWRYETEPDPATHGRSAYWPRGKVVGGSSSINALVYHRGMPFDFTDWEAAGATGWGWEAVRGAGLRRAFGASGPCLRPRGCGRRQRPVPESS